MKNASREQRTALAQRAREIGKRLGTLRFSADGRMDDGSLAVFRAEAERILRENRTVGAMLVLTAPQAAEHLFFGAARLRPQIAVTEKTCMRLASVSKLVMTFGALSMMADGLLALDEDIGSLLGYAVRSPAAPEKPVTLRMLLTHSAGLRDEGSYGTRGLQENCALRELLCDPENWTAARPGEGFHYSNLGAGVAGVLMERAENAPFDALMQRRVFAPLGIRASYAPSSFAGTDDLSDGYRVRMFLPPMRKYDARAVSSRPQQPFDPERDYLVSAGRLITDSDGLERLTRLLASENGMGVLPGELLELMRTKQDGLGGVMACGRGLNTAALEGVFPGFSPVGHQGVAYGMCSELFADAKTGCGVALATSGTRLVSAPPLMRTGFDLMALGFAAHAQRMT